MKSISALARTAATILLAMCFPTTSNAGGVIECNYCRSPKEAAIHSGSGLTVIMDFEQAKLDAFDVEYDREFHKWRAFKVQIPRQIDMAFLRILESSNRAAPDESVEPQAGS